MGNHLIITRQIHKSINHKAVIEVFSHFKLFFNQCDSMLW